MDIGIGLPSTIPGVEGTRVLEWARRAEAHGFTALGTIDRLVYANLEPLVVLAAAAAVTRRPRLVTAVLLAPLRANSALLAKQAASIDRLSGGRLVLGLGVGGRPDDFEASGLDVHTRGRRFDAQLEDMRRIWQGEPRGTAGAIGPAPSRPGGPPLLMGGTSDAAMRRTVRYADGWIAGGGGPPLFSAAAERVRAAWQAAGRDGQPHLGALAYFALGPQARQQADAYLKEYYAFAGPRADQVAAAALLSVEQVRDAAGQYQEAGCDELILFPCDPAIEQVDRLAEAVRE
jgi:alkanesulfonate monooxygenase SsuD/methylene tetrahydromethanopterin reductase-like flavin-dependent oxidoreductase (luciferase family)